MWKSVSDHCQYYGDIKPNNGASVVDVLEQLILREYTNERYNSKKGWNAYCTDEIKPRKRPLAKEVIPKKTANSICYENKSVEYTQMDWGETIRNLDIGFVIGKSHSTSMIHGVGKISQEVNFVF